MSSRESDWTRQICDEMKNVGAQVFVLSGNLYSSGLPDRLVVSKYWCGLLEFKGEYTITRTNQVIVNRKIRAINPNFAFIVRKPNMIQVPDTAAPPRNGGKVLKEFDGTGLGLLLTLQELANYGKV